MSIQGYWHESKNTNTGFYLALQLNISKWFYEHIRMLHSQSDLSIHVYRCQYILKGKIL